MGKKIGIAGAGGWGITIARLLAKKKYSITLWEPVPENCRMLAGKRESTHYFPGFKIPESVAITGSLEETVEKSDFLIIVVRSSFFRETARRLKNFYQGQPVLTGTKGFEISTGKRMSEILATEIDADMPFGVLSGPTIAKEIAAGMPSAAVAASSKKSIAFVFQQILNCDTLRVYTSGDVAGVETGGAFKNVIAIGAGIIDGMELGINTKSAYLTRGLNEMIKIGCSLGGKEKTFRGLSGIGDLITTSFSGHSRNRSFGEAIIKTGKERYLKKSRMVIEGIPAAKAFHELGRELHIDLPITESLHGIIYGNRKPEGEIIKLMRRKTKEE
ncbi:MAG: NAD(P)-dependent glycerol-3-phosphate dehydrogenase [Candidatus Omnitrophica bacterium]|nr:NAD(P)-dependent glycerol-3-phosphate dehydrogenase [Candidatus Omnitrophota bacterium]